SAAAARRLPATLVRRRRRGGLRGGRAGGRSARTARRLRRRIGRAVSACEDERAGAREEEERDDGGDLAHAERVITARAFFEAPADESRRGARIRSSRSAAYRRASRPGGGPRRSARQEPARGTPRAPSAVLRSRRGRRAR